MKIKKYLSENTFTKKILEGKIHIFIFDDLNNKLYNSLINFFLPPEDHYNISHGYNDINAPVVYKYGETISWEFGSQYNLIIRDYENYCSGKEKNDIIIRILRFINKVKMQFSLFFLMDELLMDGYLQTEAMSQYGFIIPDKRIYYATSVEIVNLEYWNNVDIKINITSNTLKLVELGNNILDVILPTKIIKYFDQIYLWICSLKYPI